MALRSSVVAIVAASACLAAGCGIVSGLDGIEEQACAPRCGLDADAQSIDGAADGDEGAVGADGEGVRDAGTELGDVSDAGSSDTGSSDSGSSEGGGSGGDASTETDSGREAGQRDGGEMDAAPDAAVDAAHEAGRDTGGPVCPIGHVVINDVRSRGVGGGSDEYVELFNPTASPVTLDSTWTLQVRSSSGTAFTAHWTGSGGTVPAYGYYLIVGTAYAGPAAADDHLTQGITDAASLHLDEGANAIDTLCYGYDPTTMSALAATSYGCAGTPADNSPHNDGSGSASNSDQSLLRAHCVDTGDNSADFSKQTPSMPKDAATAPDP